MRLWQIDPSIQAQCGRDQSSEDASVSGGTEEDSSLDSPTDNSVDGQREKPSDLQLTKVNEIELYKVWKCSFKIDFINLYHLQY